MTLTQYQKSCLHAMGIQTFVYENKAEVLKKVWLSQVCQLLNIDTDACKVGNSELPEFDDKQRVLLLPENSTMTDSELKKSIWQCCRAYVER
ncbi:hypothetical protein [Glaciecola sp. 1036]|uniref:hypothetical protein n=1 Tax=Alteromonadaceae TaxID=72275 RepID=UPI003D061BC3